MGSTTSHIQNDSIDEKKQSQQSVSYLQQTQVGLHIEIALEQKPLKVGYLLKRGFKNFASWKRRYCILLNDGYFNYYNSKRKIKGSVNFCNAHQCISCSKDNKKFFILTSKRTWEFKGESKNEANKWIKLIQSIMNNNTPKSSNNSNKSVTKLIKYREFDSDDESDIIEEKEYDNNVSKYRRKRNRRSTLSSVNSIHSINNIHTNQKTIDNYITFESWKISCNNYLRDVIEVVEHRQKNNNNYNPNNYNDGYHIIATILKDDNKLKKIFNQITNNKKYMSMKQYISSMSLIQKSRAEIESIATKLLHKSDDNYMDIQQSYLYNNTSNNHNHDFDTQSMISTLSTLSYFDDTQSMISELSTVNNNNNNNNRYSKSSKMHSFKISYTGFDGGGGAFSILEHERERNDSYAYDELELQDIQQEQQQQQQQQNINNINNINTNIRVEIPVNPASEILGNFLGASCGLCVPGLDVITSMDSAETYKLLSEYTSNIDVITGSPPTLLVYEELDGVSLSDLKKQLEVVSINLHYKTGASKNSDSNITTQERIQKYFVAVVRKTFGMNLPYHFSHDGRSMIRDAGFVFAVDMFLFNISRFPVKLPFEGKSNANNLFISSDEDGDSALYGLSNRFMGGHDIIEMPYYLLNGGKFKNKNKNKNKNNNHVSEIKAKQQQYTQEYFSTLQSFLSVLSDYYQKKISPNMGNKLTNNSQIPTQLLHGKPIATTSNNNNNNNNNKYAPIDHCAVVNKCLRPIANYLYIHCGFELIIIDEYNNNPSKLLDDNTKACTNDNTKENRALKILEIYRNKLIDNMITLLTEGILIGISEIADKLEIKDIDIIIQDIRTLDEFMNGLSILDANFLKLVLRLFHSTAVSFQLNIEESSSEESGDENYRGNNITPTPTTQDIQIDFDFD